MRRFRPKVRPESIGCFHCVSRVVDRQRIFRAREKEKFIALMREYEDFCEVKVLTFTILSNHFHLQLQVPPRPTQLPSPDQVLAKLRKLTSSTDVDAIELQIQTFRKNNDQPGLDAYMETFYRRMWNLSAFMKQLKQRFTQWFNALHGRKGTLWESRFRSSIVQPASPALLALSAYTDLNPVRAGLVSDPLKYRWSGYAQAVAGDPKAIEGIQIIAAALHNGTIPSPKDALSQYRILLYRRGSEDHNHQGKPSLKRKHVLNLIHNNGQVPIADLLSCRVRHFIDGVAIGSRQFVEDSFRYNRLLFGPNRKSGARKLRPLKDPQLFTLRDLKKDAFG